MTEQYGCMEVGLCLKIRPHTPSIWNLRIFSSTAVEHVLKESSAIKRIRLVHSIANYVEKQLPNLAISDRMSVYGQRISGDLANSLRSELMEHPAFADQKLTLFQLSPPSQPLLLHLAHIVICSDTASFRSTSRSSSRNVSKIWTYFELGHMERIQKEKHYTAINVEAAQLCKENSWKRRKGMLEKLPGGADNRSIVVWMR